LIEMGGEFSAQERWKDDRSLLIGLRLADVQDASRLRDRSIYGEASTIEVDGLSSQRNRLAPPQPSIGEDVHEGAVLRLNRVGEAFHLCRAEDAHLRLR
jgi:hypothetical protein